MKELIKLIGKIWLGIFILLNFLIFGGIIIALSSLIFGSLNPGWLIIIGMIAASTIIVISK